MCTVFTRFRGSYKNIPRRFEYINPLNIFIKAYINLLKIYTFLLFINLFCIQSVDWSRENSVSQHALDVLSIVGMKVPCWFQPSSWVLQWHMTRLVPPPLREGKFGKEAVDKLGGPMIETTKRAIALLTLPAKLRG